MDTEQNKTYKPENQSTEKRREIWKLFDNFDPEKLSKMILLLTGVLYVMGLVTVNRYLLHFGLTEFSLINAQYVYTGALMALLPVLTVGCFITITAMIGGLLDDTFSISSEKEPIKKTSNGLINGVKAGNVFIFTAIPCIVSYFLLFAGPSLLWLERFWLTIVLSISAFLTGFLLFTIFLIVSDSSIIETMGIAESLPIFHIKVSFAMAGAIFFVPFFIWYQGLMIEHVYPNIAQQFGGGQPIQAQLQLEDNYADHVEELGLILIPGKTITPEIEIIFEGSSVYVLRLDDGNIVHISKDNVKALLIGK